MRSSRCYNRAKELLAVGHQSCGAGNPSEHVPAGRRYSAPHRAGSVLLWLSSGI